MRGKLCWWQKINFLLVGVDFYHPPSRENLALQPYSGWGGPKRPPTSFSHVTSTNVGFGPQNLLTFSFNPFATLVQNFKFVPSASPKLLNLNQDHPSKKQFFRSNPYKIEVMVTSFIEMLELPNFYRNARVNHIDNIILVM